MSDAIWDPNFSYAMERADRRRRFKGRAALLSDKRICQVFEQGVGNRFPLPDKSLRGFPWPTFVLGSGCLAIASGERNGPDDLIRAVQEHLAGLAVSYGQPTPAELVEEFIETLYEDRVRSTKPAGGEQRTVDVAPEAARLTLLAARLTRFFHLVKADRVHAPPRWDSDAVVYDPFIGAYGSYTQGLEEYLADPISRDLDHLIAAFNHPHGHRDKKVVELVAALLADIREGFPPTTRKVVRLEDLRSLTEVAWYLLTEDTAIYPGWSDLLLGLLVRQGRPAGATVRAKRRPIYHTLYETGNLIARLFENPTQKSFEESRETHGENPRVTFYDAVAETLQAQAVAVQRQDEGSRAGAQSIDKSVRFPPASCFVTSFDIELEMALWRAGQPFIVVLPVHVQQRVGGKAALVWLIGEITPSSSRSAGLELEKLREQTDWRVLTSRSDVDRVLRHRPIVVRLSGSPLMMLPRLEDLREELASLKMPVDGNSKIYHAVTVDEYSGLQRSNAELVASHRRDKDASIVSTSLPQDLSRGSDHCPRFWLAFGAQVSDPAIRYQLFAEITKALEPRTDHDTSAAADASLSSKVLGPPPSAGSSEKKPSGEAGDAPVQQPAEHRSDFVLGGLAVNFRVEDDDAALMYWLDFTIVEDDCANFIDDLAHYRRHLQEPDRRPSAGQCPIEG